jgi:molybdopterin biosynthesis enzyme
MASDSSTQRITRLTPLSDVLALIGDRVAMAEPCRCLLAAAQGHWLAQDVTAPLLPPTAIALRDGFAVEAAGFADAGPYAPAAFASAPSRIDAGEVLPRGCDAVLPIDALTWRGDRAEAIAPVAAGEGVLPAGSDARPNKPLRRAGRCVRASDVAVMTAAGVADVMIRAPRIHLARGRADVPRLIGAAIDLLSAAVVAAGGKPVEEHGNALSLEEAMARSDADAVIAVGGTGRGRDDDSVRALARHGRVEVHGIAVSPGESAAFGFVGPRPVLLVPGRLDAVLAIWCLIGRHLLGTLAGGMLENASTTQRLTRKVTSPLGLTEMIPVACTGGTAEPLAAGYLSFESLTGGDGWIIIPPDSEGVQAGTQVAVRSWP